MKYFCVLGPQEAKKTDALVVAFDLDDTALNHPVLVPLAQAVVSAGGSVGVITGNRTQAAKDEWARLGYPKPSFYETHDPTDTVEHLGHWKAAMCKQHGVAILIDDFKHGQVTDKFIKHDKGHTLGLQVLLPPNAPMQKFGGESFTEQQLLRQSSTKLHVPAERIADVLAVMDGLLDPDEYDPGFVGQNVRSDYFDSPSHALLKAKVAETNYVTIRLRRYGNGETQSLEAKVPGSKYREPFDGSELDLNRDTVSQLIPEVANALARLCGSEDIAPACGVWYQRYARRQGEQSITLDVDMQATTGKTYAGAILELKSECDAVSYPAIDALNLEPIVISKYVWAMS